MVGKIALVTVGVLAIAAAVLIAAFMVDRPRVLNPATSPAASSPTPGSASPTPTPKFEGTIGAAGGVGAATQLSSNPRCAEAGSTTGVADLTWRPAAQPGSEQRVALTIFADGFDTGNFQVSPSLPPGAAGYTWSNTNPGGIHRWRVLTLHGDTWTPSEVASFMGATCVGDSA